MKKLTKLLSIFVMASVVGTGVAGMAACNSDEDTHTHHYSYTDNGDGKTHTATCDNGDSTITDQLHVDGDKNNVCDNCGGEITSGSTVEQGTVTNVGITAKNDKVNVEGTLILTATVTVTGNATTDVTWSSADEAIATVSDGVVTGVAKGKVTITATSAYDNTKSATYDIEVIAKGEVIPPKPVEEIPTYADLVAKENVRVQINTEAAADTLLTESDGTTAGIYVKGSDTGYEKEASIKYAEEEGVKVIKQIHDDVKGKFNVYTIVNPGSVKGEVEGVFTTKVSHIGSNGDFIVLNGNNSVNIAMSGSDSKDGADKGGSLACTYNNADGKKVEVPVSGFKFAQNEYITVYFKLNLTAGTVTVVVNDVTALNQEEVGMTAFNYLQISSSNSGQRTHTTKDIVICGAVKTLDDSKAEAEGIIEAERAKYADADYTTNVGELDAAVTAGKAAIAAATDVAGVDKAVEDCKAALKVVLKDADIEAARTAALTALTTKYSAAQFTNESLTGDDEKYNNKSAYETKISEVTEALKAVNTAAEMKTITDDADTYLEGITNAVKLTEKKAEVVEALEKYAEAKKDADPESAVNSAINTAVELQTRNLNDSVSIADANDKLTAAKAAIDAAIDRANQTLAKVVEEAFDKIGEYRADEIDDIKEAYGGAYADLIDAAKEAAKTILYDIDTDNDTTENRNLVETTRANVEAEVDRYLANYAANVAADEYKDSLADGIKNEAAWLEYADISFVDLFKEATNAGREAQSAAAKKIVDDFITALSNLKIEITLDNGEVCRVPYGTQLTLSHLHVSGFDISSATLETKDGDTVPVPAEASDALIIYNPVNVTVTDKTPIEGFKASEKWEGSTVTEATAVGDEGVVQNNNLYKLTVQPTSTYISTGVVNNSAGKQFTTATISGTTYANVINVCPVDSTGNSSAAPITITANASLKSLTIYTLGAGANGTDARSGNTYYVINDGAPQEVSGQAQAHKLENLKMGDVVKVYVSNASSSGGMLYLAKVEAEVDENKIEKTVTVNWKVESNTVTETYHYYDEIAIPEDLPQASGVITGWTYNGNAFVAGSKLPSGTTATIEATVATANLHLKLHVGDSVEPVDKYLANGETLTLDDPEAESGYKFVGWYDAAEGGTKYEVSAITPREEVYDLYAVFVVANESWVVQNKTDIADVAAGTPMVDGKLFSMQAEYALTVTTHSKTTVKPVLQDNSSNALQKGLTAELTAGTSKEVTITAKDDITLTLYVVFAQNAFNGNRKGTVQVKVGEEVKATETADRANYTLTVTLKKGEVAKLIFTNSESKNAGQIWIFGAEAVLAE